MKLLTKANEAALPALYATENIPADEKVAVVKFFNPTGGQSWFGIEYDPQQRLFFGYVTGTGDDEFGYFSLDELAAVRGRFGLGIERDRSFPPTKISVIKNNAAM